MKAQILVFYTGLIRTFTIQRPGSGGDLPQGGEFNPFPVARRVNSSHTMMIDDDIENGNLGPYQDRPRTFPNMRGKAYTPWVRILCSILHGLLFWLNMSLVVLEAYILLRLHFRSAILFCPGLIQRKTVQCPSVDMMPLILFFSEKFNAYVSSQVHVLFILTTSIIFFFKNNGFEVYLEDEILPDYLLRRQFNKLQYNINLNMLLCVLVEFGIWSFVIELISKDCMYYNSIILFTNLSFWKLYLTLGIAFQFAAS